MQEPTGTTPAAEVTVEVPVPVTVEVTRLVAQPVIVEATPGPPQSCAPASFDEADELVIGALLPLSTSGDMLTGFGMQAAMSIAIDEINGAGGVNGRPVRLVTYDSEASENTAAAKMQMLAREDCAVAVTGIVHNNVALAAANRANSIGIPLIIAGATTDEVPAKQYPYVFRIAPSEAQLAEMPAKWLAEVGDYNGDNSLFVNLVIDSRDGISPEAARLEQALAHFGITVETIPVDLPASDFSSVIARIVSQEKLPDAVFIMFDGAPALELEQQIRAAGIGPQRNSLIVNNEVALDSDAFWHIIPDGVGTVVSRVGPWRSTVTSQGQTFALKYAGYFDEWPEATAFAAYDAVYLIADALQKSESPNGDDLRSTIKNTDAILASGQYSFPYPADGSLLQSDQQASLWNQWPDVQTLFLQYDELNQSSTDMPVVWPLNYRSTEGPLAWTSSESN